ncbi:MAG: prephenate dehydrogenase/arogenate dehydrogenase family protein [Pseudomonadota bacterium]
MSNETSVLNSPELTQLREQLDEVDRRVIRSIAERQKLVQQIGALKARTGHGTRDFSREKVVLEKAQALAVDDGLEPELAVDVLKLLIRYSLTRQEQDRLHTDGKGSGQRVLIVGGQGRMGQWFAAFFVSQGYEIFIADPKADPANSNHFATLGAAGADYDIIVIATTLALSAEILDELGQMQPRGLVFDVGSLKSPLRDALQSLCAAGVRVTSVHPMFGPSTQVLAGRQVIFVDVGDQSATDAARQLFASTMATAIDMSIDEHDRLIAYVLGLSHLTNIAFVDALKRSGIDANTLAGLSSPTYDALLGMGTTVVHENPHLYYEIQHLNEFGQAPLDALLSSVSTLRGAVVEGDQAGFVAAMRSGREFIDSGTRDGSDQ